jgi:hypothetical protein
MCAPPAVPAFRVVLCRWWKRALVGGQLPLVPVAEEHVLHSVVVREVLQQRPLLVRHDGEGHLNPLLSAAAPTSGGGM